MATQRTQAEVLEEAAQSAGLSPTEQGAVTSWLSEIVLEDFASLAEGDVLKKLTNWQGHFLKRPGPVLRNRVKRFHEALSAEYLEGTSTSLAPEPD